jgi:peptidoglycan/LPS O-acetylase OafA/YrhL
MTGTEKRIPALDMLRGLAAVAVMVPHYFLFVSKEASGTWEAMSAPGVEVFFLLSGFVLGPQIILCAERRDLNTLATFLARRWMRTIPPYLVALIAISIIFSGTTRTADFLRYATYTQNLFFEANRHDYFPVAWSLSVEEWYYVIFPPIAIAFAATIRRRSAYVIAVIAFIAAITVIRTMFGDLSPGWGENVRRVVVFRIDSIAYGFLLYLAVRDRAIVRRKGRWLAAVAFLATGALLIFINVTIVDAGFPSLRAAQPFASAAFGASAVLFFASIDGLAAPSWARSAMSFAGRVSYPIYLFHLVVLYAVPGLGFLLYFCAVVLIAAAFHYSFEQPLLAMRPRYSSRQNTTPSMAPAE